MKIYPAIDLYEGKVVRLARGDFKQLTVYSTQPEAISREWESQGAEWIHVVDLEGAKTGILKNLPSLLKIRQAVKCKIQFGGGLRTFENVDQILKFGVNRVVLGTKALDEKFFKKTLDRFGPKIAVGLDIRNDMVQTEGWLKDGEISLATALKHFKDYAVETIIYTDIQKDGMLQGPDFFRLSEVLTNTRARILLSRGVGSLKDIEQSARVNRPNFEGLIVGRALYEKKFSLREALHALKNGGQHG